MTTRDQIGDKLVAIIMGTDQESESVLALVYGLYEKANALVELMEDAERNHGSLVGTKTLRGVNELRLELSKWR